MRLRPLLLALALLLLPAGLQPVSARTPAESCPRLTGLFLQPLEAHRAWSRADWTAFFEELAAMRMETLVLQWSGLDRFTVFDADPADSLPEPMIDRLLDAAEAAGIRVWIGLVYDPDYWTRIQREAEQLEVYLRRHLLANRELLERLLAEAGQHPAFAGWYLTEEIEDVTWQDPEKRALLRAHLQALGAEIRARDPQRPIAISGFTGARLDPAALAALWRELLEGSAIDLLLLQDGFGVQPMLPEDLEVYLEALERETRAAGLRLGVVTELFTQTGGPPLDEDAFTAEPASLERIVPQLRAAAAWSALRLGFSAEYATSAAGRPSAAALGRRYQAWLGEGCP